MLHNGQVLIAGGVTDDPNANFTLCNCEIYDPTTSRCSITGSMNFAREAHTATLLGNGKVLASGGLNQNDSFGNLASCEVYDYWDNPVPVELVSFTAEAVAAEAGKRETVELRWQTVSEANNYGFEIERASDVKPKRWQRLGFLPGHGTSSSLCQYSFMDNTVTPFGTYIYRLKQIDTDGSYEYSPEINVSFQKPITYQLQQNYPNPFSAKGGSASGGNSSTVIAFNLPQPGDVKLVLVNILGNVIKVITEGEYDAGRHEVVLNAADLASGIYFYRIEAGSFMDVKKLVVMK